MGEKLAKANADVESPSQPGNKSIITDPLDKYCSRERLWEELCTLMRDPLLPSERPVLKTVEITENDGQQDVTLRVILDGEKLKQLKLSQTGEDVCHAQQRLIFCRETWEIWSTGLDPRDGSTPTGWTTTRLLSDPLRIECWGTTPEGQRKSGEVMAKHVQDAFLTPLLLGIASSKIPVHCQVELPESGRCVMSESLEEWFDYDQLWRELVGTLKQMNLNMGKLLSFLGGKHASELEVEDISDRQFVMQQLLPKLGPSGKLEENDAETQAVLRLLNFTFDDATGELRVETSLNGQHEETGIYKLLRDPLRIAYWKEQQGTRRCGREAGQILQLVVKLMVDGNLAPEDVDRSFFW